MIDANHKRTNLTEIHGYTRVVAIRYQRVDQDVRAADWSNLVDIKRTFNSADKYRECIVFNVGGNNFPVIAMIAFRIKVVFIRAVLTHRDYDRNEWRSDCES